MNIIFDFISRHYSSPETQHSQVLKYAYFQTVYAP